VPVDVLFTKFDALLAVAMSALRSGDTRKLPIDEKVAKAHQLTDEIFNDANVWGRLSELKYAPKYNVRIGGINVFCSNKMIELTESPWMQEVEDQLRVLSEWGLRRQDTYVETIDPPGLLETRREKFEHFVLPSAGSLRRFCFVCSLPQRRFVS
jgi:hypothetical protein